MILNQFEMDYQFRLSLKTIKKYHRVVMQLLTYTEKNLEDITKKDIRCWMNHLLERGYKTKTRHNNLCGLKTFFRYCVEEDLLSRNPAKDIAFPKMEETLPRYLTGDQLTHLRKLHEGNILERTMIEVLYATGMRVSELVNMERGDIHWNERFILIPKGKGKKERIVVFTRICEKYLKKHLENNPNDSPYVFASPRKHPNPYSSTTITHWFAQYSKLLGFKVTPHSLRHTFAAHLARKGMPVEGIQQLLGHDGIHSTRIYTKLYDHARKDQYDEWM